jgi:RNA polymerase sigma-70 factor (sigma-E family)
MMAIVDVVAPTDLAAAHREQYRGLVRLAALLVDDVTTCEEIVQDAFVAVFARADRLRSADKLPAYLRSAVLNGARSTLRRRGAAGRLRPVPSPGVVGSAESTAVLADEHAAVLRALRSLPDRQRDVLALRYWGDLSESEIADALGIAPGTVKTHAKRGLAALATMLEDSR